METQTKCPHCGFVTDADGGNFYQEKEHLLSVLRQCPSCGDYYTDYYRIKFIGSTTNGCNMYPADGESEASMSFYGVELYD